MDVFDLARRDLGVGIGLRSVHFPHILEHWPEMPWFEVLSENYMNTGGRPLHVLDSIAERYPVVMHGVSLNLCSTDPLDFDYLRELRALRDRCGAAFVSDHLCWTGVGGKNLHDLLPIPYTEEALQHTCRKVEQVQDCLEAPLVLENPSTYLEFAGSTMSEWDFLTRLATQTGCGLLLDVNNVYVCSQNHGFDPRTYLEHTAWDHVVQFHLAGHTRFATHLLDTHSAPACDEVWELFRHAQELSGGRSTLFEWDADIPSFDEVWEEARKAEAIRGAAPARNGVMRSTEATE
ncbi:MAG: DUF692 domain-containing protein [Planctomycetes bacterium]|nr:DUF692 domain-containing protein [Planctomycetota bacterium]MCB9888940.1 DUF692 domain-containing protein [Planctomycetota bacterium]